MQPARIALAVAVLLGACRESSHPPSREEAVRVASERTSALWGAAGELWAPAGRLPDFSFAGYHAGEDPIPAIPVKASVKDFGAKGDGITDDSDAFLQALASVSEGAIFIPSGRYLITKIIPINKSHVVLRGESRDSTVLFFPKTLHEVLGPGRDGGPYGWSWGGAWIWVNGDPRIGDSRTLTWQEGRVVATVTSSARRGDRHLEVSSTAGIEEGQMIRLVAHETDGLLTLALHDGHQLDGRCMMDRPGQQILNWLVRVDEVKGRRILLDRPLRTPVSADWKAEIWSSEPVVEEVGIEHLTIEFPVMEYQGHHNEPGQSAISLRAAYNSWVRDVAVVNFDNGIFFWYSKYCTAREIVLAGRGGHYGVNLAGCQDCLLTEFRIDTISVHDLSVANLGNGNVFSWGQGVHINFGGSPPHRTAFRWLRLGGTGSVPWFLMWPALCTTNAVCDCALSLPLSATD